MVDAIVAAGLHGELNRRIREHCYVVERVTVRLPAERIIDAGHPDPSRLVPARSIEEHRVRVPRFLAGAHDIEAFARAITSRESEVVRFMTRALADLEDSPT
jgi:hypothetical protein